MKPPTVTCANCGATINEPPDQPPEQRAPCPVCGSKARNINVSAEDRLRIVDEAYAQRSAEGQKRLDDIIERAKQAQAEIAEGSGEALDATVETHETGETAGGAQQYAQAALLVANSKQVELTGELVQEQGRQITDAIRTLTQTIQIGQGEAAKTAEKLNKLTEELVRWTRVSLVATVIAVLISAVALLRPGADNASSQHSHHEGHGHVRPWR
jgi:polyhydroxyalkanoate synthesis regulator phasin